MKLLIDSDILIDFALQRRPFQENAASVIRWCGEHRGSAFIAPHTISNAYYIIRKNLTENRSIQFIHRLISLTQVMPLENIDIASALILDLPEFEDALQVAAALRCKADYIITRNLADFEGSPVPAVAQLP